MRGFSEEERMIRDTVAEFAASELSLHARERDATAAGGLPEIVGQLAELGVCGLLSPESVGGIDAGPVAFALAIEEIARACPSTAAVLVGHIAWVAAPLGLAGAPEAEALALGEGLASAAVGRASSKNGGRGLQFDSVPAAGDASLFAFISGDQFHLVDKEDGVELDPSIPSLGLRAADLRGVRVRDLEGRSHYPIADRSLPRIGQAALLVGLGRAAIERATRHAQERRQFGRSIGSFGAIRTYLAETVSRVDAARSLTHEVARQVASGGGAGVQRAVLGARLAAGRAALDAADRAVQILGGYGYCEEYDVERHYRDAMSAAVLFEGPTELRDELALLLLS